MRRSAVNKVEIILPPCTPRIQTETRATLPYLRQIISLEQTPLTVTTPKLRKPPPLKFNSPNHPVFGHMLEKIQKLCCLKQHTRKNVAEHAYPMFRSANKLQNMGWFQEHPKKKTCCKQPRTGNRVVNLRTRQCARLLLGWIL